jgi:AcrR family transcriptional regulator
MPRRLARSHDDLRAAAIAAARACVSEGGLPALNARRIAAELGCSVGSLYNLFVDLDDLVLHVAASVLDDMGAALFAPGLPEAPREALIEIARRYIRFARDRGQLWAMVFEHCPTHGRPTPAWQTERVARLKAAVRAAAAPAFVGSGRASTASLDASIDVLWASVHGIAVLSQQDKLSFVTTTDPEALAERLVVTFLAGLG